MPRVRDYDLIRKRAGEVHMDLPTNPDDGFKVLEVKRLQATPEAAPAPAPPSLSVRMLRTSKPQPARVDPAARLLSTIRHHAGGRHTA